MSINKLSYPNAAAPIEGDSDWSKFIILIQTAFLNIENPIRVISGNIKKGSIFQIGGSVYIADADTAITGVASEYIKITPDTENDVADAAYVADLTGVTWNDTYNGYYDASGNLYLFNEAVALAAEEIAVIGGRYLTQESDGSVKIKIKGNYYVDFSDVVIDASDFLVVE